MNEMIERVSSMEQALNRASAAVNTLLAALADYEAALPQLRALESYYTGPLWLSDYDADRAGLFPAGMARGVLSEDSLHDLFSDNARLRAAIEQLSCSEK